MSRYIDADLLQEDFKEVHGGKRSLMIDTQPTADVAEVRHGHWKILRPRGLQLDRRDSLFECSACGMNRVRRTGEILNYCPNCGAKMDGGYNE